ncbi:tandem-95 repeat protein [Thermodesulfobacteriota bacterium]
MSAAENKTVTVTWGYDETLEPMLGGFKLYFQGDNLCQTNNPADRSLSCPVTITEETNHFTITAFDIHNYESAHSDIITIEYPLNNNAVPFAENRQLILPEDSVLTDILVASDADNDPLNYQIVSATVNGVVEILDDAIGSFRYTPHANSNGSDFFTYKANDGTSDSNTATVTISVTPVNDLPVAVADSATTNEETEVIIPVLLNDNDVDNDPLILLAVGNPVVGTASLSGNTILYTPPVDFSGTDSFTYQLSDGFVTVTGDVAVSVQPMNDSPVVANQSFTTQEDIALYGTLVATDADDLTLTYSIVTNGGAGIAEILNVNSGAFQYTPDSNAYGSDTFTFRASDGKSYSDIATVTILVTPVNDVPVANAGPDQDVTIGDIVILDGSNSYDTDNNISLYEWVQIAGPVVTMSDPNAVQPMIDTSELASDTVALTFQLTVTDTDGAYTQDNVLINVSWVNESPVAEAGDDQTVFEGENVILDASLSSDPDDGIAEVLWTQTTGPDVELAHVSMDQVSFTAPDTNMNGTTLVFELLVTDFAGLQATDTVRINVSWINDPPQADAGSDQSVITGDLVYLDASSSYDNDDGINSIQWQQTKGSPVTLSNPAAFMCDFTAPMVEGDPIELEFMVTVIDQGGLQSADSVIVTVTESVTPQLDINSDTLLPESRGGWVAVYIELPDGYFIEEIDIDSIGLSRINGVDLNPWLKRQGPAEITDYNNNGITDLRVKFNRQKMEDSFVEGDNQITVRGSLFDGTVFEQTATAVFTDANNKQSTMWIP